jgi:ribosomal protein S18 acetylase RimI-like enzyme
MIAAMSDDLQLDNPVRTSLEGPHQRFAQTAGRITRYHPDFAPFVGLPDRLEPSDWPDVARLIGPGGVAVLAMVHQHGDSGGLPALPPGWREAFDVPGVQMVAEDLKGEADDDVVSLGHDDVPEMLDLVKRTEPGPFRPRTVELGSYLGIRRDGRLVAMAGERICPPGFTEISAVCTDDDWRGHGFASRLILAVAHGITARGDIPMLHAAGANKNAIRLYERLGFTVRREVTFGGVQLDR